jgi:hypothetical protein
MGNWLTLKRMGGELWLIKIKKYFKVNGKMIKKRGLVFKNSLINVFIKETIKMVSLKD